MTRNQNLICITLLLLFLTTCNILFFLSTGWNNYGVLIPGYAGLYFIYRYSELNVADIACKRSDILCGLKYGVVVCGIIFVLLMIAFALDSHLFQDARYHLSILTAFFRALILEPIKIILFEEIAFRGILLAFLLRIFRNKWHAVIISSIIFGLWHILPSFRFTGAPTQIAAVFVSVIFTALAGIILAELRLRSKSLAAPILVHWFVNSMAIILAAFSWR